MFFVYFCKEIILFPMNFILTDFSRQKVNLLPLTYFRPVGEIRCGIMTLKEKWEGFLNTNISYLTDEYLQEKFPVKYSNDNVYINSAIFPARELVTAVLALKKGEKLVAGNRTIAIRSGKLSLQELEQLSLAEVDFNKKIDGIFFLQDIFRKNSQQIISDFKYLFSDKKMENNLSPTNTIIGKNPVYKEADAVVEACIFNTEAGPVYIGKNVKILEGSLLRGPLTILDNSVIKMGAKIYGGTTIGPNCKVGGEVKETVFLGNSNKGHDGYLGDAVIGEWCNLGADTNNSNLKNNYSNVKLWNYLQKDFIDTGLQFCGLIMGDHSKSGISTMFNTGTVVGVNSNIFGSGYQPKFIPSFQWGGNDNFTDYKFDKAMEVVKAVFSRRNKDFDKAEQRLFENVYKLVQSIEK